MRAEEEEEAQHEQQTKEEMRCQGTPPQGKVQEDTHTRTHPHTHNT